MISAKDQPAPTAASGVPACPDAEGADARRVPDRHRRHRSELRRAEEDGCVYKYRVEPKYLGLYSLPDNEIKVIYQVTGGHQPQTGDFTVQGGQARVLQDVPLEGPPGAQLKAAVTKVEG